MRQTLLLVLIVLFAASAQAIDLQTLAGKSDRILRGRVMSLSYHPGVNQYGDDLIYTDVYVRTSEPLKGDGSDMVLTVEGGTWNGVTLTVSDMPEFQTGQDVVLFAKKQGVQSYALVAGSASVFTIIPGDKIAENGKPYLIFKRDLRDVSSDRR